MTAVNDQALTEDFEFAALNEASNYRRVIVSEFEPFLKGRVVEIGAGIGQITEGIAKLPSVEEIVAIEPDPRFHAGFAERLPSIRLVRGTIADLAEGGNFDAAIMVNVLEHIEKDESELARLRQILQPNQGHLCVLVPARRELYSKIDKHFGHFRRYTKKELREKLFRAGFQIRELYYFNFVGYFAWGLRFRLMGSLHFDIQQVRLFDRRIFPIMHRLEKAICRPPVGQSLIAVAQAV